jgi:hypothetical protein
MTHQVKPSAWVLSPIDSSAKIVPTQAVTVGLRSEFQSTKAGLRLGPEFVPTLLHEGIPRFQRDELSVG